MLKTCFAYLLLGITYGLAAQDGKFIDASIGTQYPFTIRQFSTADGLPQSSVLDLHQKADGTLLILTANGIVSYDGNHFATVTEDRSYLNQYNFQMFWSEKKQQLYSITYSSYFFRILPDMRRFELPGGGIWQSFLDEKNNRLLLSSHAGCLFSFDLETETIKKIYTLPEGGISSVGIYQDNIYIGTQKKLYRLSADMKQHEVVLENDEIIRMYYNPWDKKYYFIGKKAIWNYDGNRPPEQVYGLDPSGKKIQGLCVLFPDAGTGLIGTSRGLYYFDKTRAVMFRREDGMPSSYFQAMLYDSLNRTIYVGTGEKGFLRLQLKTAGTYFSESEVPLSSMNSIIEPEPGKIITAINCCNIIEKKGNRFSVYAEKQGNYTTLGIVDNAIYAGTAGGGVCIFKGKDFVRRIESPEVRSGFASCIFQDSRGDVWIGNIEGLSKRNGSFFEPVFTDSLKQKVVTICEKRDGSLLVGGEGGVHVISADKKSIRCLAPISALADAKEVRYFYEDAEGKVWICTYNGGLYCHDGKTLRSINAMKNCRLPPDPFCLARDTFGYLNITSNTGLYRIRETDLDAFYDGRIGYLIPFIYRNDQGIMNTEFNGGFQNNFLKASNGKFYFPTIEGICEFRPELPRSQPLKPELVSLRINDKPDHTDIREMPRDHGTITFLFRSVCLNPRNNVYYQYRLDGLTSEWSELQRVPEVHYHRLRPGDYVFRARAIDAFNAAEPRELRYSFTVPPHFYETRWFIITAVLVFLAITILVGRVRVQFYRRRAEAQEKNEKQIAILELKAIQAQMNPHFVFNCLSSLKYYIVTNDTEKADNLLVRFSQLIRKFLDYSNSIITTLRQETELLEEYLRVEQLRSGGSFTYEIVAPQGLLSESIPSFIIQPFVENSIKHGISNLTAGKGHISVRFTGNTGTIICEVEDNGVGREFTGTFADKSTPGQTSKGIALVFEKTNLINEKYKLYISIAIRDKKNEAGEATGTHVILTIPKYDYSSDN